MEGGEGTPSSPNGVGEGLPHPILARGFPHTVPMGVTPSSPDGGGGGLPSQVLMVYSHIVLTGEGTPIQS